MLFVIGNPKTCQPGGGATDPNGLAAAAFPGPRAPGTRWAGRLPGLFSNGDVAGICVCNGLPKRPQLYTCRGPRHIRDSMTFQTWHLKPGTAAASPDQPGCALHARKPAGLLCQRPEAHVDALSGSSKSCCAGFKFDRYIPNKNINTTSLKLLGADGGSLAGAYSQPSRGNREGLVGSF